MRSGAGLRGQAFASLGRRRSAGSMHFPQLLGFSSSFSSAVGGPLPLPTLLIFFFFLTGGRAVRLGRIVFDDSGYKSDLAVQAFLQMKPHSETKQKQNDVDTSCSTDRVSRNVSQIVAEDAFVQLAA